MEGAGRGGGSACTAPHASSSACHRAECPSARALQRDSPHVAGTAGRPPCPAGVEETNVGLCRGDGGVSHAIVPRLEGVA